jgi:nitrate reductase gamma subunit
MSEIEIFNWIRGPALQIATLIFVVGVVVRILGILLLGRRHDLSEARGSGVAGGFRTIISRMFPDRGTLQRSTFNVIAGYVFHIGFLVTLLFYTPHILLIRDTMGVSWPALPTPVIDATAVVTLIALIAVLIHRVQHKVMRYLSRFQDYLVWLVTFLPVLTGYLAFHRAVLDPQTMITLHILSVELLMVIFPFTKLMHTFTLFMSRYYNGYIGGRRGVRT